MIAPDRVALAEELDRRIVRQQAALASTRRDLALSLAEIEDTRLFRELGFSTLRAYVTARLRSLKPKTSMALARLGHALKTLPKLDAALAAGEVEWTKARDTAPILTPENEDVWVPHLAEVTSERLRAELEVVKRGDPPPTGDIADLPPARESMRLTFEASDAEIVRQAVGLARAESGLSASELDAAQVIAILARRYVADAAQAAPADATDKPTDASAGAPADNPTDAPSDKPPDASTGAADKPPDASTAAPAKPQNAATVQTREKADRPPTGEPYRIVLAHCPDCRRTTSPDHEVRDTIADEAACDAELVDMTDGPTRGHVRRTIPPSTRMIVLHRYRWRCAVPHCQCRLWLDVHHLVEVAAGGKNDVDNLVPLCPFHHRLIHDGRLALERLADGTIVVEHADGRRYSSDGRTLRRSAPRGARRARPGVAKRVAHARRTETSGARAAGVA